MTLINKSEDDKKQATMPDYEQARREFSWEAVEQQIPHLPTGGINIAYVAIDAQVEHWGRGDKTALRCWTKSGCVQSFSYGDLRAQTNRFAHVLAHCGIQKGEVVFALMPRHAELYIAALGALKHGSVFSPLFSAFGPEPIRARMSLGHGKVLLTTAQLYTRKISAIRADLPDLHTVIIAGQVDAQLRNEPGIISFDEAMAGLPSDYPIAATHAEDRALLHFTSGTTGLPKGAIHVHGAVIAHMITGRYALDLHADDRYWCTADPGWVTGTSYGIIAPLCNGVTMIVDEGEFDPERWYRILEEERVSVWYTAPTAMRMMMKSGDERARQADTSSLRFIASVGEPLNPEAVYWGQKVFKTPIHDNWWQTETGGIMIANFASLPIKPGSMGKSLPGIDATILRATPTGYVEAADDEEGELSLRSPWPSLFRGYLDQEERYRRCFTPGGWYLSGDLAKRDKDGYFWFVGRADDMIKSAGHLIGPFEVENALIEHPAIAEAAVIGIPDALLGESVKAFVTLHQGYLDSQELRAQMMGFVRKKLGPSVAPREIAVVGALPKTRSGKIMRRLLKARELGLPEGDTSTLEDEPAR